MLYLSKIIFKFYYAALNFVLPLPPLPFYFFLLKKMGAIFVYIMNKRTGRIKRGFECTVRGRDLLM